MKKTNKQGVSLIVLVITIIVMIILAGTIILSLDNNGIIGKAQEAVNKTNLAEVQNLAQLAWAEAYLNNARTDEELKSAVDAALEAQEITAADYPGYTIEVTTSGVKFVNKEQQEALLNHSGIIPKGATYITGAYFDQGLFDWDYSNAVTYNAGEAFPTTSNTWDIYAYNGITYYYNAVPDLDAGGYMNDDTVGGWSVDSSWINMENMLLSINGRNVISFCSSYGNGGQIDGGCVIPEQITDIRRMFELANIHGPVTITINSNPTRYENCFSGIDMSLVTLAGSCSRELKQLIANTGENADQVTIID